MNAAGTAKLATMSASAVLNASLMLVHRWKRYTYEKSSSRHAMVCRKHLLPAAAQSAPCASMNAWPCSR